MKKVLKKTLGLLAVFSIQFADARVKLPTIFSDNMVLQQKTNAAIWGTTDAGKTVEVSTTWSTKKYTVVAGKDGAWKIKMLTPAYGGPYTVTVSDGDKTTLSNVLIGEVWVCSGQSNMEMPLAGWGKIQDYEKEIAAANYPQIRLLQVDKITSNVKLGNVSVTNGGWTPCTPQYVADFSSVAYFFAREIYTRTKVPIGLVHTSWGGTIAEAWTSAEMLKTMPDFAEAVQKIEAAAANQSQEDFDEKMKTWLQQINAKDAGYANDQPVWLNAGSGVSDWQSMTLPTLWEDAALPDFDGIVWFKKKVTIPADWAGRDVKVTLGTIDDNDITWFNSEKVGQTEGYSQARSYTIPGNLVKEGENEITVRVFDGAGGGGIYGEAKLLALTSAAGDQIPLSGPWFYKIGVNLKDLPARPTEINGPNRPTVLYNAMINPFIQYSIRGAIWYQGESNAGRAHQYRSLFANLIKDWRNSWKQGNFPFYYVQLANFMKATDQPVESAWAELREAQLKALALPNTGMAVAIDIGNPADIHPKNKQEVGRRLALIALAKNYGIQTEYSGPLYQVHTITGNQVTLTFNHNGGGLKAKDGAVLSGFAVAGADRKFHWANASVVNGKVVLSSDKVAQPVAVRYNWADNPTGNLYNTAGFPASPFRTDDWNGVTFNKK